MVSRQFGDWMVASYRQLRGFVQAAKAECYKRELIDTDSLYGRRYYEGMDRETAIEDATEFADIVRDVFDPNSIIEFGCGTGRLLYPYHRDGITVYGIDGSKTAVSISELPADRMEQHDLRDEYSVAEEYDIALCVELLEHIPESDVEKTVRSVANAAPVAIVTAAKPGQGGTNHFTEKSRDYWISKFRASGMEYDETTTEEITTRFDPDDLVWIPDNLFVFKSDT